jgi:ATP-dependent RNA helicase SUPV3L1/SUV3
VVYGALPAETRQEQARLFNTPGTGFNVLVATDAIGMGLNLNIRRVIFSTLLKPSGPLGMMTTLSASAIKQLAGRAGRRSRCDDETMESKVRRWIYGFRLVRVC